MTRALAPAAGVAALLVALAACGDGEGPMGRDPETVEVAVTDGTNAGGTFGAFAPAELRVRVGDTVRWVQRGAVPHTVTEGARGNPSPAFDRLLVEEGETFEVRFEEPGTFPYHCRPHFGMDGTVVVEP